MTHRLRFPSRSALVVAGTSLLLLHLLLAGPRGARAAADADLAQLSLEDLMEIEVTSVSKRPQKLAEAPAAITVLTAEDIRRAGHTSIPEALRMVPGLHVARIDANQWAVTSRGFNGRFANKLLVLIDGRSVYTPLFSGVYWEVQDLPLDDIDRIEVIRGPGGTLWGANAVNGVINIITRSAAETQGLLVSAGGGSQERAFGTVRYGGAATERLHYRVWGKGFDQDAFRTTGHDEAHDGWDVLRGGFRADWDLSDRDLVTFQGDYYDGDADQTSILAGNEELDVSGGNLLARWTRVLSDRSQITLQGYYDRIERREALSGEKRNTFDLEFQHDVALSERQDLSWGVEYRWTRDRTPATPFANFEPSEETDQLLSGFLQTRIALLPEHLFLTLGSKAEYNDYTGFEYQPSARLRWTPNDRHTAWAAVSRAVRTPSRAEEDIAILVPLPSIAPGVIVNILGNPDSDAEDLLAYELGYRAQLRPELNVDAAAFYFEYDDLRSVEIIGPALPPALFTARFDNRLDGHSWGAELEATWRPTRIWKLRAGYTFLDVDLSTESGSTDVVSAAAEGDSPRHQFHLLSQLDLPWNLQLDAALYYVNHLVGEVDAAGGGISSYVRGDLRLGWKPRPDLELELVGQNLLDHAHGEFGELFTVPALVPRSFYARVTWRR